MASVTADELPADNDSPIAQMEAMTQIEEQKMPPRKPRIMPSFRKRTDGETSNDNDITDIFLFGVVLMAIAAIVAGLLGFIHAQTNPIIAQHEAEKRQAALESIFPQADKFVDAKELTSSEFAYSDANVDSVYLVYENDEIIGYCVNVQAIGYSSTPIEMIIGSDLLNKVTAIQVVNHSETPGIGETVISGNEGFFKQFEGLSRPIEFSNQVTAVSGATFTSDGIKNGINTALGAVDEVRLDMAQPGGEG